MPNLLIHESSPYLLQHAQNPVNWQAWNEKAKLQALAENKLIIVSIGYAACHWCHVMEHESFEDKAIAALMNESYICIKIDREERPDIDQLYMDALHTMNGQGGWPLNMICLPNTKPIYGGTYFRKEQWMQVLRYFSNLYKENPEKLTNAGEELTAILKQQDKFYANSHLAFSNEDRTHLAAKMLAIIDMKNGGRKNAPKFPMPVAFEALLENYYYTKHTPSLDAVNITLQKMCMGGIYDQLRGGFSRYSVDDEWIVPHFEKMLYDNAQLLSLYSQAFQLTKNKQYEAVIAATISFLENEMLHENGGFYSAIDADSEGEEGKFYVWEYDELAKLSGTDFEAVKQYFHISSYGNFDGKIILTIKENATPNNTITDVKKILLAAQNKRIRPQTDDKQLTAWNALAIIGLTDAAMALQNKHYHFLAKNTAAFIQNNLYTENKILYRNYKNNKATIYGFLDDYAITAKAFIKLYFATNDENYFSFAIELIEKCLLHFYDKTSNLFFYTADFAEQLITRKTDYQDNVIPSSNAMMADVLLDCYQLTKNTKYRIILEAQLATMQEWIFSNPFFFSKWYSVMMRYHAGIQEIVLSGNDADIAQQQLLQYYLPDAIILSNKTNSNLPILEAKYSQDNLKIWLCKDNHCLPPYFSLEEFISKNNYE